MSITLSSELDRFLQNEVARGRYASVTEAVAAAVEKLRHERLAEELKEKLSVGIRDLEEGRSSEIRTAEDARLLRSRILQKVSCAPDLQKEPD